LSGASKKERVDVLLVERGLAETRAKAQALVLAGEVVAGDRRVRQARHPHRGGPGAAAQGRRAEVVSRGGIKLEAALDHFALDVEGALCADIGASTGGFTDCLLQRGAKKVWSIDVGRAQLAREAPPGPAVVSREGINARALSDSELPRAGAGRGGRRQLHSRWRWCCRRW